MTFIAALRHDRIDAPCLFDGPINGQIFFAYVRDVLIPTRARRRRRGDHGQPRQPSREKIVRRAIRDAGARLLFLAQILRPT